MPVTLLFAKRERAPAQAHERSRDWQTQELAELYRVRDRLAEAGLGVELGTGSSDEGDPWAVFEQSETGEVVVHIARIDGEILVANAATGATYSGRDLRAIADVMLESAPLALPRKTAGSNVVVHPRSVLTAFVAAAVVLAEMARTIERADAAEQTVVEQPDEMSQDGFLALFARLLNRDAAAPATVAGGVVFGAVAAAMIATSLAEGHGAADAITLEDATDHIVADARLVSTAARDVAGKAPRSGEPSDRLDDTDIANPPKTDGKLAVSEPLKANVRPSIETPDRADVAAPGAHSARDAQIVEADASAPPGVDAEIPPQFPAAGGEPSERTAPTAPPPAPALSGTKDEVDPPPAQDDLTRKVLESIAFIAVPSDFNLGSAPISSGPLQPVIVALADADGGSTASAALDVGSLELTFTAGATGEDGGTVRAASSVMEEIPGSTSAAPASHDLPGGASSHGGAARMSASEPAATPHAGFAVHQASSPDSQLRFQEGVVDVLLMTGREVRVTNFDFGEDLILVGSGSNLVNWLQDVEVVGGDIKIVGVNGSVIWLTDSYHTFA